MCKLLKVMIALFFFSIGCASLASTSEDWVTAKFEGIEQNLPQFPDGTTLPFSFTYGGQSSANLLPAWDFNRSIAALDSQRTQYTLTYLDPASGLQVRCVAVEYHDYPTVEWVLYFKNTGSVDTAILENINALDMRIKRQTSTEYILHHQIGAPTTGDDYRPIATELLPGATKFINGDWGWPTSSDLSYFNLQMGDNEGLIIVNGWPGQWAIEFVRDATDGLQVQSGQEFGHFKLYPGEEIRTPLIVLQFWNEGDRIDAQNVWRRWMLAYNVPKPGGQPLPPMTAGFNGYYISVDLLTTAEDQKSWIDKYVENGLDIDYWWNDAGWYVNSGSWMNTGTWEPDPVRYPNGLLEVTDYARSVGMKNIVWFEPERATAPSWMTDNHPDWLLSFPGLWQLVDLGNPDAWNWVTNHIDSMIKNERIEVYRQDFNLHALEQWQGKDTPDREGMTEIKHVMGYLAFWDELLRRNPELWIDSCASGGRRNDLETLRRSVPLWRSDWAYEPDDMQCFTYGISFWMPYYGTGVGHASGSTCAPYTLRSDTAPFVLWAWNMNRTDLDFDLLRLWMKQWREIAPNYLGDYYPLTPFSQSDNAWLAWQFNSPETGKGVIQAFRRVNNLTSSVVLTLRGLQPDKDYSVTNMDTNGSTVYNGQQLMEDGLLVEIAGTPGSALFTYEAARPRGDLSRDHQVDLEDFAVFAADWLNANEPMPPSIVLWDVRDDFSITTNFL